MYLHFPAKSVTRKETDRTKREVCQPTQSKFGVSYRWPHEWTTTENDLVPRFQCAVSSKHASRSPQALKWAGTAGKANVCFLATLYLLCLKGSYSQCRNLGTSSFWGFQTPLFSLAASAIRLESAQGRKPEQRTGLPAWVVPCLLPLTSLFLILKAFIIWGFWLTFWSHLYPRLEGTPVIKGKATVIRAVFTSLGNFPPFWAWLSGWIPSPPTPCFLAHWYPQ